MSAAFIGGNLDSIEQVATRLDASAAKALDTSSASDSAAERLMVAIDEAMTELVNRFGDVAGELTSDISQSHSQLEGTDWQGTSRENAVAIKADLQSQVNRVLETATTSLNAERDAFHARAEALVLSVRQEFGTVMTNVDAEYRNLALASRKTRDNLMAADETIRMG